MLVTMRGEAGEFNPWQVPMGRNAEALLRLAGLRVTRVAKAEELGEAVAEAGRAAFEEPAAAAVLIAQPIVGIKHFDG